jgi:hypothetical protein
MSTLNAEQIAEIALSVGFNDAQAIIATAVALAESSGNTNATSANPDGGVNTGLWQIDTKAHPQWTEAQLKNAITNARAAFSVSSSGTNWSAWQTYTQGTYKNFANAATKGVGQAILVGDNHGNWFQQILRDAGGDASKVPGVGGLFSGIDAVGNFFNKLGEKSTWIRIGEFAIGALLLAVALNALVKHTTGISPAGTAAKGAALL